MLRADKMVFAVSGGVQEGRGWGVGGGAGRKKNNTVVGRTYVPRGGG